MEIHQYYYLIINEMIIISTNDYVYWEYHMIHQYL